MPQLPPVNSTLIPNTGELMKTRTYQNRRGVTLLFVISMIVLFLLMGTTFVVVSNDFLRSSRRASRLTVDTIVSVGERQGQKFMNEALLQLLRGPDLDNVNSPLRGHSILADMYGYGITSFVKDIRAAGVEPADPDNPTNSPNFLLLDLIGPDLNDLNSETLDYGDFDPDETDLTIGHDILSGNRIQYSDIGDAPGRFNGQLLSFVSDALRGVTCRIIDHQVFLETDPVMMTTERRHRFAIWPIELPPGVTHQSIVNAIVNDNDLTNDPVLAYDEITAANGSRLPTRIVINGRPFSGTGAGLFDPTEVGGADYALSNEGHNPNQVGRTRQEIYENYLAYDAGNGPQPNPYATNECYDAPDVQNMFLAGIDSMGNGIPSFWRPNLDTLSNMNNREDIRRYSFRPEFSETEYDDMNIIDSFSTCTEDFPGFSLDYDNRNAQVDNDGLAGNEGIWLDINLPTFTDELGRRVKPLVSYTVVDLDSLVNVNVHGNRSQILSNQRFSSGSGSTLSGAEYLPYGGGFGPAEVYLPAFIGDSATRKLLVGYEDGDGIFTPGRYAGGPTTDADLRSGLGPAPGREYVDDNDFGQDAFSAYKLFGYPNYGSDPNNLSVLGFHYFSPMDIYGRFRTDYPQNLFDNNLGFQTSMPVIDVHGSTLDYSELFNNPYETDFSPPPRYLSIYDQLFTLEELEGTYRREDNDLRGQQNRLLELAELADEDPMNPRYDLGWRMTTDSWEVPTLIQEFLGGNNGRFENLQTKLYDILARTDDNTNGWGVAPDPDSMDEDDRHFLVMQNISGFYDTDPTDGNDVFNLDPMRRSMLSNEIRSGRPFDVNRPFGDGEDYDENMDYLANGVIDEPRGLDQNNNFVSEPTYDLTHPDGSDNDFDHDQDGYVGAAAGLLVDDGQFARQLFARQLYVLTLLVTELVDRDGNGVVTDDADFPGFNDESGNPITDPRLARFEYRKMIAQWAINVADFRDPDSIMSPFEIDLNPFDGWDVDGDLTTNEITMGTLAADERIVLWGTERPELLITESINGHDRRTEDLMDNDGMGFGETVDDGNDMTYDSRLAPHAFSFFELYNPWVTLVENNGNFPNQFLASEFDPNNNGIDLALRAYATGDNPMNGTRTGAPIWRVVVANNLALEDGTIFAADQNGFSIHSEPDATTSATPAGLVDNMIRRYVYFTDPTGSAGDEFNGAKVYAPPAGVTLTNTVVEPGQFAVAGSAGIRNSDTFTTHLGRRAEIEGTTVDETSETDLMLGDTRRIVLDVDNGTVDVIASDNTGDPLSATVFPLESVNPVNGITRSFSTTDPVGGYDDPMVVVGVPRSMVAIADGFKFVDEAGGADLIIDQPVDLFAHTNPNSPDVQAFASYALLQDQYTNGAFVILLQRLANPLIDHDPVTNPYRTVDSKGSDVVCFNGITNDADDPANTEPAAPNVLNMQTFERRGTQDDTTDSSQARQNDVALLRSRTLWKTDYYGLHPQNVPPGSVGDAHHLDMEMVHSLGRMNDSYITPPGSAALPFAYPMAWLTWNNRPYNSALELANVPYTSSYYLTSRFDTSLDETMVDGGFANNLYDSLDAAPGMNDDLRVTAVSGEFPHLLNFHADVTGGGGLDPLQLHRVFDYLEVPSRYIGTETYISPARFISNANNINNVQSSISMAMAPPYDFVSNYRVPGKININTVPTATVWDTLMSQGPDFEIPMEMQFDNWQANRGGDDWSNPYRYAHSRNYMAEPANAGDYPIETDQADTGLFRRRATGMEPMFDFNPTDMQLPARNDDRNAYFRNHVRQRLGNLTTMRSSVFAIWISIGYFEIKNVEAEDSSGNIIRMNLLDNEIEDENGQSTRNRGFFIFDRSIPVAFEPGRNHNVEKAIRVSSYIE